MKLILKCFILFLVIIIAFMEKLLMIIAGIVNVFCNLIFLSGILIAFFEIIDKSFNLQSLILPLAIMFLGFALPYIVISIPVGLGLLKEKTIKLTFNNNSGIL